MFRTSGFPEVRPAPPATGLRRALALLDEIVLEVHSMTARFPPEERDRLGEPLRVEARAAIFALVAGDADGLDRPGAGVRAIAALDRLRYLLALARRLGLLDVRRYRGLVARQDKAAEVLRTLPVRLVPAPALLAPFDGEPLSAGRMNE